MRQLKRTVTVVVVAGIAAVVAGEVGCAGCRGKAPLAYVPQDAVVVVLVSSVNDAVKGLVKLTEKFQDEAPVKAAVEKNKSQLIKELGFDPEKPESMKAKGFDPGRGMAISVGSDGASVAVVLGVEDKQALEKFLRETINKYAGGRATFKEKEVGGLKATLLVMQGEEEPRAAWVYHKGHLVMCPKSKDGKVAEYAVKLTAQESSIKDNKTFGAVQDKLGKHQAMVYVDGASLKKMTTTRTAERLKTASDWMKESIQRDKETLDAALAYLTGAGLALELSGKGVILRGYASIPEEKGKAIREILSGKGDSPDFGELIGPDALAVGRISLDLKKLMDRILEMTPPATKRRLYRDLDRLERETKISFERDVLGLLAGRYAAAFFAPTTAALKQGFSLHRPQDALGALSLVGMAQVTDTKKAADLLATAERMMTGNGMDVRVKSEGDTRIYFVGPPESPMVSWTVHNEVLVVATGDRLAKTLSLMRKGGDNVLGEIDSSRAKKLFKRDDGIVLYYNLSKTADAIRGLNLPSELKLILSSVTSTLAKFADVTWTVEPEDNGMLGELSVRLK